MTKRKYTLYRESFLKFKFPEPNCCLHHARQIYVIHFSFSRLNKNNAYHIETKKTFFFLKRPSLLEPSIMCLAFFHNRRDVAINRQKQISFSQEKDLENQVLKKRNSIFFLTFCQVHKNHLELNPRWVAARHLESSSLSPCTWPASGCPDMPTSSRSPRRRTSTTWLSARSARR